MKKMLKQLFIKLGFIKEGEENKEAIISYTLRLAFRTFFEGVSGFDEDDDGYPPVIDIPVRNFEITDISFDFLKDKILMKITLGRPGILIGRQGSTIDKLKQYLSYSCDKPVEIRIEESKLWGRKYKQK